VVLTQNVKQIKLKQHKCATTQLNVFIIIIISSSATTDNDAIRGVVGTR